MKDETKLHHQHTIKLIKNYIVANPENKLTLKYLSQQFYISPFHLSRVFKFINNQSLKNYIQNTRLDKAFGYIAYSSLKITDIASITGFNGTETFSRSFKRQFKISPDDLRNIIKELKHKNHLPDNIRVVVQNESDVLKSNEINSCIKNFSVMRKQKSSSQNRSLLSTLLIN